MTSYVTPKKGVQFVMEVSLRSQTVAGQFQANPTIATGDVKVSTDGAGFANITTLPTLVPSAVGSPTVTTGSKVLKLVLSASEMNGDNICVLFYDPDGEWCDKKIGIQTTARQIDDLTALTAAQIASAVWTDTVAADFTTALSIGKTIVNGVTLGTGLTINAYTGDTPQTGDAYKRIGAEVGSPTTTITQDLIAINAKTTNLPAAPASTTNITAGTITTVTTVTNQHTLAAIATAIWTDTTAGDFTAALSIGKTIVNGVTLGTGLTINAYTGNTAQTGDAYKRIGVEIGSPTTTITQDLIAIAAGTGGSAPSAATIATAVWQDATAGDFTAAGSVGKSVMNGVALGTGLTIVSVSGAVGSVTGNVGGNVVGNVVGSVASVTAGVTLAASAVQAIWDALTSALTTVGSIGKKLSDWVIGTTQTGDAYARIGPAIGSPTTTITEDLIAINAKTTNLPSAPASTTNITAGTITTVTNLTNAPTNGDLTATMKASVNTEVDTAISDAALATAANLATVATYIDTEVAAIKAKTDNIPATPAATGDAMTLTSGERNFVADALLNRNIAGGSSAGRTVKQAVAVMRNKVEISGGILTVYDTDDVTPLYTAAVTTAAGNPVTAIDPA